MNNELQIFKYTESHQIRTTVIDGEVWFVAKDVCDVLGLADVTSALRTLDEDEKLVRKISGAGQIREMATVSEPGLYKLIMRSTKPQAKDFTRWVTHTVLPSIRQTGMYVSPAMQARIDELERKIASMEKVLSERYSLSVLGETVLGQTGAISFKDGATFLSQHGVEIGQNRLFKYCRDKKLLCSRRGKQWNRPTQAAVDKGLFNLEISGGFKPVVLITPKGLQYLTDEFMKDKYPLLVLMASKGEDETQG